MKRLSLLILSLFLAYSARSLAQQPATAKKDECTIAGMVVKLAGSEPIKGATVRLKSMRDPTRAASIVSDAGGRFQLKSVEPGPYRLTVIRNGYVTQEYGQRTPDGPGSILTLRAGQEIKDLLFRMIPSAVVAGRIINEEGEPLAWAQVSALREIYSRGKRKLDPETTVPTNDRGEFRLFGLRPGRYFISASYKPGQHVVSARGETEDFENEPSAEGYMPTYYPGSPDPARASALPIKAGEEIPSVEILLQPTTVFSVRGHIFNIVSRRNAGVMIQLESRNTGLVWNYPGRAVQMEANGTYEIKGVLPGRYTVLAYFNEEGRMYQGRMPIEVGNADVEAANVAIAPGMSVTGHITWDGKPSLARNELIVRLESVDSEFSFGGMGHVVNDTFTLRNISEGAYRLAVFGQSSDCFVKSVRFGGTEAVEDGFTVLRGVEASLDVTLSSRGARLQGDVTDADGLPAVGVRAVLIPDAPRREHFRLYKDTTTDQYGRFDLHGIAPGDYKVFSWDHVEDDAWQDPDFLRPFESKGEHVTLEESEGKSVNPALIRTLASDRQQPSGRRRSSRRSGPPHHSQSLDFRDAALRGEFLELQRVMAGNHAVNGACQLDHARLILDAGGMVRVRKCRAGFPLLQIAP